VEELPPHSDNSHQSNPDPNSNPSPDPNPNTNHNANTNCTSERERERDSSLVRNPLHQTDRIPPHTTQKTPFNLIFQSKSQTQSPAEGTNSVYDDEREQEEADGYVFTEIDVYTGQILNDEQERYKGPDVGLRQRKSKDD
jgi:hypothetical protein